MYFAGVRGGMFLDCLSVRSVQKVSLVRVSKDMHSSPCRSSDFESLWVGHKDLYLEKLLQAMLVVSPGTNPLSKKISKVSVMDT